MRSAFVALLCPLLLQGCFLERTPIDARDRRDGQVPTHDAGMVADAFDLCPADPDKASPGMCGCGIPDADGDADGVADCLDECPTDPMKTSPGACGCGIADVDGDMDGVLVCDDCDDADSRRYPGAAELCNAVDDDCTGTADDRPPCTLGCADGTREGFLNPDTHPRIAGCAGAWTVRGVITEMDPSCGRQAGNDGVLRSGDLCNVSDLCADGWHVCRSPADVAISSPDGCESILDGGGAGVFFVQRTSGPRNRECAAFVSAEWDNLFGCGDIGVTPDPDTCAPLTRVVDDYCASLPASWDCGTNSFKEALQVTKNASDGGGVLCCRDAA